MMGMFDLGPYLKEVRLMTESERHATLISRAIRVASYCHEAIGQTRDLEDGTTEPYFEHPRRVANLVNDMVPRCPPWMLSAAYLHDVLEDTPATWEDLYWLFGDEVAGAVDLLSKPEPEHMRSKRYKAWLQHVSDEILVIKTCDRIDNLRSIPGVWDKRKRDWYVEGSSWLFAELARRHFVVGHRYDKTVPMLIEAMHKAQEVSDALEKEPETATSS